MALVVVLVLQFHHILAQQLLHPVLLSPHNEVLPDLAHQDILLVVLQQFHHFVVLVVDFL